MSSPNRTLSVRAIAASLALGSLALWVVSCSSDADTATTTAPAKATTTTAATATPTQVDVDLVDYGFDSPASVPAGLSTFVVHDSGKEQHELQLVKLNDGVTWDQVETALHGSVPDAVAGLVTMVGGVAPVEAGGKASVTVDLEPGDYGMLCFIPAADGAAHMVHGMAKPFEVTKATGSGPVAEPKAKGDIVVKDMTVTLPDGFDGKGTWRIVNEGEQTHQAAIMKLADGKTRQDLDAYLTSTTPPAGAPPATVIGGGGALAKGGQEWVDLDLGPADYAFTCFVPDPGKGFMPHFMEGMLTEYSQS